MTACTEPQHPAANDRRRTRGPEGHGKGGSVVTDEEPIVRNTKQRSAVSAVLADAEGFNSAQELHAMLRSRGERVGLTTVYRTLQGLADTGEIDVMRPPGGEHLYRRCSQGHHHHLVCRACGRAVEVEGPAVESWADRVAAQHGYRDVSHTLEIFGTCPDCFAKRK